ncbi:hypothetical protein C7K25_08055 [Gulosibacter molinativorax]|uniref:M23ase beta-sheet core domain-containing protein n=1 Tax=Gulosibacter molinativorax TaxID=256821 RepID=A0ABT7C801_9MICO|nr:hypothetical protein [Gulosibacter molinativorax]
MVVKSAFAAQKRRQIFRIATSSLVVAGLATGAVVYLFNPTSAPATIELIPTATPSPTQPAHPAEDAETTDASQGIRGGVSGNGDGPGDGVGTGQGGAASPESATAGAAAPGPAFDASSAQSSPTGQPAAQRDPALGEGGAAVAQHAVRWPLETRDRYITSGFGPRNSPCSGCSSNHRGLDFSGAAGSPIGSIAAGIVIDVSPTDQSGLGVHVVVEHRVDGKMTRSVYAHMLTGSLTVSAGDVVVAGEKLGELGNTGASTGPHLHLEIVIEGTHVDPYTFLKKYADDEDVEVIDRPCVDWHANEDPDAEGEGWLPDEDTLEVDPKELPDASVPSAQATTPPSGSGATSGPSESPMTDPSTTPTESNPSDGTIAPPESGTPDQSTTPSSPATTPADTPDPPEAEPTDGEGATDTSEPADGGTPAEGTGSPKAPSGTDAATSETP